MTLTKTARREFMKKARPFLQNGDFNKVASEITPYVRVRLYEDSFADRILAVRTVTEQELIPEIHDDSYYVLSNVEQGTSHASVANFGSQPMERYLAGERYKIPLGKHASDIVQKNKNELLAYNYDLLEDAMQKDVQKLGELRDAKLIYMANQCVARSGRVHADVVDLTSAGPVQIEKVHTARLASVLQTGGRSSVPSKDVLKATRFLLNDETRADFSLLDLEVLGDAMAQDVFVNGFTAKTLQGITYISSIKYDLLTEADSVTLIDFNGNLVSGDDITVNGVNFALTANTLEADAASAFAKLINESTDPRINKTVDGVTTKSATASSVNGKLRLSVPAVFNWDTYRHEARYATLDTAGLATAPSDVRTGLDLFDIIWAFPDAEFIGEIIRVAGRDIEPEIWKTPGTETVNRMLREWFGMGFGNENGVAKLRMQRSRYLG